MTKHATHEDTDDKVVEFLSQYGTTANVVAITESGDFQDMIVVEFESGKALVELHKLLPYTFICATEKVTYDILELSAVCAEVYGELKTRKYMGELKELAKLTGQDYIEVRKGLMSLLGQSVTEQGLTQAVKTCPEFTEETVSSAPSTAIPAQFPNAATLSPLQGAAARAQRSGDLRGAAPLSPGTPHPRNTTYGPSSDSASAYGMVQDGAVPGRRGESICTPATPAGCTEFGCEEGRSPSH